MKKQRTIIIIIFIILIVFAVSVLKFGFSRDKEYVFQLKADEITKITTQTLPSPTTKKEFQDEETISKIVEKLNGISGTKINVSDVPNGWDVFITIQGNTIQQITTLGNKISVGEEWFKIGKDQVQELKAFIEELE